MAYNIINNIAHNTLS